MDKPYFITDDVYLYMGPHPRDNIGCWALVAETPLHGAPPTQQLQRLGLGGRDIALLCGKVRRMGGRWYFFSNNP